MTFKFVYCVQNFVNIFEDNSQKYTKSIINHNYLRKCVIQVI